MSPEEQLCAACESGSTNTVTSLFSSTTSSVDPNFTDELGWTPLQRAGRKNHVDIVRLLLAHPLIEVNKPMSNGWTPLHAACSFGSPEVVELLIRDRRVVVDQADNMGCTPLYCACLSGKELPVKLLLACGRGVDGTRRSNPGTKRHSGRSPAGAARQMGYESIGKIIDDYVSNPMRIVQTLRNELNWRTLESDILAMMVFVCDGLLQVKPLSAQEKIRSTNPKRFFGISSLLPFELQMVLASRCNGLSVNLIPFEDRERAFQNLALIYDPFNY